MKRYAGDTSKKRPYIMCEYSHAMGNSNGNFQEYWDIISSSKHMQGGFIWDWVDQGLKSTTANGKTYWAYGGDLGGYHLQNDENFCANGLIAADRTPHPGLFEVKKVYQDILFRPVNLSKGIIAVHNLFCFTNLDQYGFRWEVIKNGEKIKEGTFTLSLAPQQQKEVAIPLPAIDSAAGTEYLLNVFAATKNATELVPAAFEVAREQFRLTNNYFTAAAVTGSPLQIVKGPVYVSFASGNIKGEIDLRQGRISRYTINDERILAQFPEPYFWRAPTDNDYGNNMPFQLGIWRNAHINRVVKSTSVSDQQANGIAVLINYELTGIAVPYTVEYFIQNDGAIRVTASIDITGRDLPELPRFGMRMQLPPKYGNITYYGRGPWENYTDRNTASFIGLYTDKVNNQYTENYIRPQEAGYRTDIRWVSLTDATGNGVQFEGIQPVCFSAINNLDEDLDPGLSKKQQHPADIKPRNEVYVHIDLKQRGVGGDNSWGALPHEQYRLLDKKYSYSYIIRLIKK